MSVKVFLGNPPQSVIDWIKGRPPHPPQQQFATVVNNTHLTSDEFPNSWQPQPINIALSGSSVSYRIQPGQTKNIKPGTYRTIITDKQYYDEYGHHDNTNAYLTHINVNNVDTGVIETNGFNYADYIMDQIPGFTLNYDDGTSEYFEDSSYTYECDYTYNVNTNYEFTYGHKNL